MNVQAHIGRSVDVCERGRGGSARSVLSLTRHTRAHLFIGCHSYSCACKYRQRREKMLQHGRKKLEREQREEWFEEGSCSASRLLVSLVMWMSEMSVGKRKRSALASVAANRFQARVTSLLHLPRIELNRLQSSQHSRQGSGLSDSRWRCM